mgnify:CR=1 FL=1
MIDIHPDTPPSWQKGLRAMFGRVTGLERLLAEAEDDKKALADRLDVVGGEMDLLRVERDGLLAGVNSLARTTVIEIERLRGVLNEIDVSPTPTLSLTPDEAYGAIRAVFGPDMALRALDGLYWPPDRAKFKEHVGRLRPVFVNALGEISARYEPETFDCDGWAQAVAANASLRMRTNTVGLVIDDSAVPPHAYNVVVFSDLSVGILEPRTMEWKTLAPGSWWVGERGLVLI